MYLGGGHGYFSGLFQHSGGVLRARALAHKDTSTHRPTVTIPKQHLTSVRIVMFFKKISEPSIWIQPPGATDSPLMFIHPPPLPPPLPPSHGCCSHLFLTAACRHQTIVLVVASTRSCHETQTHLKGRLQPFTSLDVRQVIFAKVNLQPGASVSFIGPSRRFLGFANSILIDLNSANRTTKIFVILPKFRRLLFHLTHRCCHGSLAWRN